MNKLFLSGNLTKDAENKAVGDKNVINFTVAVNEGFGDKKTTMFVNCKLWGSDKLGNMLKKGTKVLLQGKLSIREYEKKYYTEMLVDSFNGLEILSSKKDPNSRTSEPVEEAMEFMDPVFEADMPF